jgi:lysophospholipase L1-like esterase
MQGCIDLFVFLGQGQPQLKSVLAARHRSDLRTLTLGMNDAATRHHQVEIVGPNHLQAVVRFPMRDLTMTVLC